MLPPGQDRELTLQQAKLLAKQAVEIAPSEAWTQSAVGWIALAEARCEEALIASRRAFGINPEEGNVPDFYAGAALSAGEFEEAANVADPSRVRLADNQRLAHRNIYGAASFHMGKYEATLKSFEEAAALGDPLSVASLAYRAAALHALGPGEQGKGLVSQLKATWPDANLDAVFRSFYKDTAHSDDITVRLVDLAGSHQSSCAATGGQVR